MNFDDFLAKYQKMVQKKLDDPLYGLDTQDVEIFLKYLEIVIDAYAENASDAKIQHLKWEKRCRRLCELRADTSKLLLKEKL